MSIPGNFQPFAPRLDFGWIGQAWRLYTAQIGPWIGAIALYLLVSTLTAALIAVPSGLWAYMLDIYRIMTAATSGRVPPQIDPHAEMLRLLPFTLIMAVVNAVLYGGLYRMALKQVRGEAVRTVDLFSAFDVALPLAIVALVFAAISQGLALAIPGIGSFLSVIVQGLFMLAPLVIVDRRANPIQALTDNLSILQGQRWMSIFFYFVLALLSGLGALLCGIGIILTMPLLFLTLGLGYLILTQQIPPISTGYAHPSYGQPEPGVWPPPPNL